MALGWVVRRFHNNIYICFPTQQNLVYRKHLLSLGWDSNHEERHKRRTPPIFDSLAVLAVGRLANERTHRLESTPSSCLTSGTSGGWSSLPRAGWGGVVTKKKKTMLRIRRLELRAKPWKGFMLPLHHMRYWMVNAVLFWLMNDKYVSSLAAIMETRPRLGAELLQIRLRYTRYVSVRY